MPPIDETAGHADLRSSSRETTPDDLIWHEKLRLASEIAGIYLRARRRVGRTQLQATLAELRGPDPPPCEYHAPTHLLALRLARRTSRTLRLLRADTRCLMQSVVVSTLLAHRGVPSRLVIGVREGAQFGAHAWVEYQGLAVLPADESEFVRLVEL